MIDSGFGKPTRETVVAFEEPRLLAYSAADDCLFGMYTNHTGLISCEPDPGGGTRLTWCSYARPGRFFLMHWMGRLMFRFMLGRSIRTLERRFPVS